MTCISELEADAELKGRVGTVNISPDRDAEVKLQWISDGKISKYIRAVKLRLATVSEISDAEKLRAQWCALGRCIQRHSTQF